MTNTIMYRWNDNLPAIELLPCQLCGGTPKVTHIGTTNTKRRSIIIRCSDPQCMEARLDAHVRLSFDDLEVMAARWWNHRPDDPQKIMTWRFFNAHGDDYELTKQYIKAQPPIYASRSICKMHGIDNEKIISLIASCINAAREVDMEIFMKVLEDDATIEHWIEFAASIR